MELDHLPPEARGWFLEGFEHHQAGDLEEAIACYRRSLDVAPSAEAHTFLGWAYSHQKALDAEPSYHAARVELAKLQAVLNRPIFRLAAHSSLYRPLAVGEAFVGFAGLPGGIIPAQARL